MNYLTSGTEMNMSLKSTLKNNLYKNNLIYSTRWQLKNLREIFAHAHKVKQLNREKKDYDKPRIIFYLQYPETWNSMKTVYEAAVEDGDECLILCVPKPCVNAQGYAGGLQDINEAYEFAKMQGLQAVNAYDGLRGALALN